jgi:UDP-glucose 4-epimerase
MKTLLLGSGGFIGRNLLAAWAKKGVPVQGASSRVRPWIDPHSGIVHDHFSIPKGTEAVVYLAQSPFYHRDQENPIHLLRVNMEAAVRVAELACKANVRRFIYASSGNVYSPSFSSLSENSPLHKSSWYVLSKVQAEETLALFRNDMDVTIVRLFGVYGPGQQQNKLIPNLADRIRKGEEVLVEANPNDPADEDGLRISLCYIQDLTNILLELIENTMPFILNVAGGLAPSIRQISSILGQLLGRTPRYRIAEPRQGNLIADISLLQRYFSPGFTPLFEGLAQMLVAPEMSRRKT